jgi:TonB family protein
VNYPGGAGISKSSLDYGRVVVTVGRQAVANVSFVIDEKGHPLDFKVNSASDDRWGPEAIAVLQSWRFKPGVKDGQPVPVPCTVTLVWGHRSIPADVLRDIAQRTNP